MTRTLILGLALFAALAILPRSTSVGAAKPLVGTLVAIQVAPGICATSNQIYVSGDGYAGLIVEIQMNAPDGTASLSWGNLDGSHIQATFCASQLGDYRFNSLYKNADGGGKWKLGATATLTVP